MSNLDYEREKQRHREIVKQLREDLKAMEFRRDRAKADGDDTLAAMAQSQVNNIRRELEEWQ